MTPSALRPRRTLTSTFPFLCLLLALTALPQTALAQGEQGNVCVRDFTGGATCTANDVRIEALNVISVTETCNEGTLGETEVVFEALVSADGSPDRYDIGLFLALDGGSARDGDSCYHDFLSPPLTATPTYGDANMDGIPDIDGGPWWNGDTDGDSCGDIESNTQVLTTLPSLRFACIDSNADGSADVSVCTSWDNNTGSACNSVVDAFPGTPSKCSCTAVELGIAPAPELTIEKTPETQQVMLGGTASWDFAVTSQTTIQNVSVSDPDCDTPPLFTGGDTNNDMILTPDETWTYTCSKSAVTMDFTNTVTVTGDAPNPADGGMTTVEVSDTDSADTTVAITAVSLVKTGTLNDGGDGVDAGDTISYTFDVENTGTITLTNVAVTDPLSGLSTISCPGGNPIPTLLPGVVVQCTASYTITQADVDAGAVDNTAEVTSNEDATDSDSETVTLAAAPSMTLVKTGTLNDGGDGTADAGDTISYTFDVTNTGNVTLNNIAVSDPQVTTVTCPGGNPVPSLAPDATVQCTASYTLTQADVDAGVVNNTATADSDETTPVQDSDSVTLAADPSMTLVKTGTLNDGGDGTADAGDSISYTFDVTNTGNVTLNNVSVTDPQVMTVTCPGGNPIPTVAPDATVQCTASYTLTQADVDAGVVNNTATADSDETAPVQDSETVILAAAPSLTLVKNGTLNDGGDGTADAGDTISYTFDVTNTGNITLTNVSVTDPLTGLSAVTCLGGNPIPALAPGVTVQCTASYTVTQADVDAGSITNTATADSDQTAPVQDTETVPLGTTPVIGVAKNLVSVTDQGGGVYDVALDFVVENLGGVTLTNVQVTDNLDAAFPAPATYTIQSGPTAGGTLTANAGFDGSTDQNLLLAGSSSLAVGASETISLTVRVILNGATGPFSNSATASGDGGGVMTTDVSDDGTNPDPNGNGNPGDPGEDDPTVIVITAPGSPDVTANKASALTGDADASGTLTAGDTLTYTLTVSNTGTGDALAVVLDDTPDPNTMLVVGSVTTTQGTVLIGNGAGDTEVQVLLETIGAGGTATITFDVVLDDPLAPGVTQILNQGTVTGSNFPTALTDDPTTAPDDDPTVDEVGEEITDPTEIPTLSEWMLLLLALTLAGVAVFRLGRLA